jgi:hypothetical protein
MSPPRAWSSSTLRSIAPVIHRPCTLLRRATRT